MNYWHSQTYKPRRKKRGTIFFLCPHSTRLNSFRLPIKQLLRKGYDVVGYDYSPDIMEKGDPTILGRLIAEIRRDIEKHIKTSDDREFGMFGNSIGTFISYNILDIPEIDWVIMNTGGNMAQGAWGLPLTRAAFEKQGVTLAELEAAWYPLQNPKWKNPRGKRVLLIASTHDEVAPVKDAWVAHEYMLAHGVNSKFIKQRRLNHKHTLIRNLSQAGRLIGQLPQK